MNKIVSETVLNKHREIQYNSAEFNTPDGVKRLFLKGKIFCVILNQKISSIVCSKLMDLPGWPRYIDPEVCECQAQCYINKSITKHITEKKETNESKEID